MQPCPSCGHDNRPGARFCARCRAPLAGGQTGWVALQAGQEMKDGSYRVVHPLSKGGMGVIYLVEDLGAFGRKRVIKEMLDYVDPADFSDPAAYQDALERARERFEDEARTLAALHHPGIPDIIAYFTENERNYIVMEYVEGSDLEQGLTHADDDGRVISGQPYALKDVIHWGVQVCRVLEYLAGIKPDPVVHHDIKPANLILDRNSDQVRLVDFGTAKARMVRQPGGTVGLQKSSVYGTVGYAPPEQYTAQSEPRSDVYALSATIYHLLTDDDPRAHAFDFPQLMTLPTGIRDVLIQGLEQDVKRRPSATKLRQGFDALLAPAAKKVRPFRFRSGVEARTLSDLVALCDTHWDDGIYHLYAAQFETWLNDLGEPRLAAEAARIRLAGGNQSVGMERFLQATGLVAAPQPLVSPSPLDFGAVRQGESKTLNVQVSNMGRGFLAGQVQSGVPWLSVSPSSFEGNSATCRVTVSPFNLAPRQVHQGRLEVGGQGFRVPVPVTVEVLRPVKARRPLPRGLALVLALVVTVLSALLGWELVGRLGLELADLPPLFLDPLRPSLAPSLLLIGAATALGSVLADGRRRRTIAARGGWRILLSGLIAGTFFAALGTWLAALLWYYLLRDLVWTSDDLRRHLELVYHAALLGGAVLGAAYGTAGPGENVLETVLKLIVKLLLALFWLSVAVLGGYVGLAIAQDQAWAQDGGGLWAAIGIGAVVALIVVRSLWKFVRDAIRKH